MAVVSDPERVARHRFWPLILRPTRTSKRAWDPGKRKVVWKTKKRPIGYVAHMDAHIHAFYAAMLGARLDDVLRRSPYGDGVLAYRKFDPKRCNIEFAHEAFVEIRERGECDVLALDIEGFFDALRHDHLKKSWCELLSVERLPPDHFHVYRSVTQDRAVLWPTLRDLLGKRVDSKVSEVRRRAGQHPHRIVEPERFRRDITQLLQPRYQLVAQIKGKPSPSEPVGIPQGTPISAVLANLYMRSVDEHLHAVLAKMNGSYRRYSDDILVVVPRGQARQIEDAVTAAVREVGLEVNPKKTVRVVFQQTANGLRALQLDPNGQPGQATQLNYLGFSFDGEATQLRPGTISTFQARMRRAVRRASLAALDDPKLKIKRRKLYATVSSLGHGQAYGSWDGDELPDYVPRRGFHNYLQRAARVTGSRAIRRQGNKLDQDLAQALKQAEGWVAREAKRRASRP